MRGPEDEEEENQGFDLFKSLVGNDVLEKSTIIIPEDGSDLPLCSDTPLDLLARFVDQPPIDTLYHQEISRPGTFLSDTTFGKHFDKLLSDAAEIISRAREHIRAKTLAVQESSQPADTPLRRSRKSTEASLAQQLVEAKRQLAELEGRYAAAEGRSNQITAEKHEAVSRATRFSKELAGEKAGAAELKRKITSLEKESNEMKKRIEGSLKAADKHRQNLEDAKAEASAVQKKLKETEAELLKSKKETERVLGKEGKLEEERRNAMKISGDYLKARDESKAELATVRSQVDSVQKQAKKKLDDLQKNLDEKEAQVAVISKAAEAWVEASAEVERLKAKYQEVQAEMFALQSTLRTERERWETEKGLADAERQRLEREEAARRAKLREEKQEREREVEGYVLRISELEAWGQSRWDAVGEGCIIA
ncbi:hypothetical protein FRC06_010905 [Ceratobasidium sp. 370]|nr:hypothetical protein FRC06_010905 [Ceratobasidium sp. 370]